MSGAIACISTVEGIRTALDEARRGGASVGLVPTMGALHGGHLSLIRAARGKNQTVVVSIFVNPAQFGPDEDLATYPRDLETDAELARKAGADLIFNPSDAEMYSEGHSTWVDVEGLTAGLCGRCRPGHFRGVCTVVTKLFGICSPDRAYFGEKDVQQLAVIRRMTAELNARVQIVSCPTVREADGLALSSRNVHLTPEQRAQAPALYRALNAAQAAVAAGEHDAAALESLARTVLSGAPLGEVEYVEVVHAEDLTPVKKVAGECVIALAVRFGEVRLIDNVAIKV